MCTWTCDPTAALCTSNHVTNTTVDRFLQFLQEQIAKKMSVQKRFNTIIAETTNLEEA